MRDDVKGYYQYDGMIYGVIGRTQIRINSRWVEGILYSRAGQLFCREKKEFLRKFKKIGDHNGAYNQPDFRI